MASKGGKKEKRTRENRSEKTPFPKDPFFRTRGEGGGFGASVYPPPPRENITKIIRPEYVCVIFSADCKRGRKKGAARKLSKNVEKLFDTF